MRWAALALLLTACTEADFYRPLTVDDVGWFFLGAFIPNPVISTGVVQILEDLASEVTLAVVAEDVRDRGLAGKP